MLRERASIRTSVRLTAKRTSRPWSSSNSPLQSIGTHDSRIVRAAGLVRHFDALADAGRLAHNLLERFCPSNWSLSIAGGELVRHVPTITVAPDFHDDSGRPLAYPCDGCGFTAALAPAPLHEWPSQRAQYERSEKLGDPLHIRPWPGEARRQPHTVPANPLQR